MSWHKKPCMFRVNCCSLHIASRVSAAPNLAPAASQSSPIRPPRDLAPVGDKTQGFFASKRMANLTNPHCKSVEEVLKFYQVTPEQGLSSTQVEEYRAKYGPNALEEQEKLSRIRDLEDQLVIICCLLFGGMGVHP